MDLNRMRQLAESGSLGEAPDDSVLDAVRKLNELQKELHIEAARLSGTKPWESYGAAVKHGHKSFASILLIANPPPAGNIVTMDRLEVVLEPYKPGSRGWVYDLRLIASRLVRDLKHGQDSDVREEQNIWGGDIQFDTLTARGLLAPSNKFWKKVAKMKPQSFERVVDPLARTRRLAGVEVTRPGLDENRVSDTIVQQMGGFGRIKVMLGAKVFELPNGIGIKWPNKQRAKGNYVEIRLEPSDTYTMEFFNVSGSSKKSVKKYEDVYFDSLVEIFEKQTGWFLSIGGSKKPSGSGRTPGPEMSPEGTKHEARDEPDEPEEDDITTSDHKRWYQSGKLYFTGDEKGLKKKMAKDKFWPNVWFISDHGNAHLITLESKLDALRSLLGETV